tara:strand:+ start:13748 stop:14545 length:798 start_codon:yes stop_codon:yes gene_type:complete
MLLDISIFTLTTTYLAISYFKQSRKSWAIAMILLVPTCIVSGLKIYGDSRDKEFAINALERIATRINWEDSLLVLDLRTDKSDLETKDFGSTLKILPFNLSNQDNQVVQQAFNQHCTKDEHSGFFYLEENQAKALYNTMAEPAGIYHNKEKNKGIEPFYYFGDSIIDSSLFDKKVQFNLELGPNSQTRFSSLSELNNTILVGSIKAPTDPDLIPTWLYFKLDTNSGSHLLHFPLKLETQNGKLLNNSTRYIGMCFPENYFWSHPD